MSARYDKAFGRLFFSVLVFGIFAIIFMIQFGGHSPNVGGLVPAPFWILDLLGLPVSGVFVIVSGVQVFRFRGDDLVREEKEPIQPPGPTRGNGS